MWLRGTGLMDYDNIDETLTFEHLLLMILYRNQTKFGIRKSNTKSSLHVLLFKKWLKGMNGFHIVIIMTCRSACCFCNGSALIRQTFVTSVCRALSAIGLEISLYSGHSFRIGAATTASAQGIGDALIKTMGRWESIAHIFRHQSTKLQQYPQMSCLL